MSSVKPGDLAIVIRSAAGNEGKICKVLRMLGKRDFYAGDVLVLQAVDACEVEFPRSERNSHGFVMKRGPMATAWLRPVSGLPEDVTTDEDLKEPA